MWSYDEKKRFDKKGTRWHFVYRYGDDSKLPYMEQPLEIYFRNGEETVFGVLRFDRYKDNPYRNFEMIVNKIMNDTDFRKPLINPDTESVWKRKWK